jgi:signal transduction histidine kinase
MSATICATGETAEPTAFRASRRWWLILWSLLVALGVLIVAAIEVRHWQELERLRHQFAITHLDSFQLGLNFREAIHGMNAALLRFQLSGNDAERKIFQQETRRMTASIAQSTRAISTEQEHRLLEELDHAFSQYISGTAEYLERTVKAVRKDTAAQLQRSLSEKSEPVLAVAENLVLAQHAAFNDLFAGSQAALVSLQKVLQLSLALLILVAAAFAALLYRAIVAPLRLRLSQTQSTIEKQERLASLGVLAAGVAHEVRNPLTAIKFRLFSLKSSLPPELTQAEDLVVIQSEISRLERIVKEFLLFARPSEPQFTSVYAARLLQDVRNLLQPELQKRGIEFRLEPTPDTVQLRADRQQIQQVLINLIQNASEAIGHDGSITLRVREGASSRSNLREPMVIIEVSDTGPGLTPETEKRLFDPFFSTKEGGTGLGLPIAARIVEKHGGYLQYLTQQNRGTTFSVVLPKAPEHESTHSAHRR